MSANNNLGQAPEANGYQKATAEWNERIGSAKVQARNWRFAFILSVVALFLLAVCLVLALASQKRLVYVAEIKPQDNIVNLQTVGPVYQPTEAQSEYMIAQFIRSIMSLPLDPVVARTNWFNAYALVTGQAVQQLTHYAQTNNPLAEMGRVTKTVDIRNFHPIGQNSYEFTWTQTQYNQRGSIENSTLYNGIFTLASGFAPKTTGQLLQNPFGIKIVYFSFSTEG